MTEKLCYIKNEIGLHEKPLANFIRLAERFDSKIRVEKDGRKASGKATIGVLALSFVGGDRIKIIADGTDEKEAAKALAAFIESGCN